MARKLENWLESFELLAEQSSTSSLIFRRWTGISIMGAVLERKVWTMTAVSEIYPNLYIFLIAEPGIGKGVMTNLSRKIIEALNEIKLAPSSPTHATIIQVLNDAERHITIDNVAMKFNSLYILSNELGVLLPDYDVEMLNKLTDIYDCQSYSEVRRDNRHTVQIDRPVINLLGGGQPGYLESIMPPVAWEQGFLSRVNFVYSGEKEVRSIWEGREQKVGLLADVVSDLREISRLRGSFTFTPEAAEAIDMFQQKDHQDTDLLHPKMHNYNARRWFHLIKLMMISSVSADNEMKITIDNFKQGFDWLTQSERTVPEMFKAMGTGGDSQVIKEAWYYLHEIFLRTREGVPERFLVAWLARKVPSDKVTHITELMITSGFLTTSGVKGVDRLLFPSQEGRW